jgi:hypothetical protein
MRTEREWLSEFSSAVATRDFARGRELFHPEVTAYGTRTGFMMGLDVLVRDQWTPVWTSTTSFRFTDLDHVEREGQLVTVAARWSSRSSDDRLRTGRCTLVLRGSPPVCVHSHFSMEPEDGGRI